MLAVARVAAAQGGPADEYGVGWGWGVLALVVGALAVALVSMWLAEGRWHFPRHGTKRRVIRA